MQFPRPVAHGPNIKLKKVNAIPPHRGLKDPVQLTQTGGRGHQHPPPDHRANPEKAAFESKNFGRYRHRGNMSDHPENAIAPRFGVLSKCLDNGRFVPNSEKAAFEMPCDAGVGAMMGQVVPF
jgi:hypothetical protein